MRLVADRSGRSADGGSSCARREACPGRDIDVAASVDVADAGGAYWLLDEIALIQPYNKAIAAEEFQLWKLTVCADQTATVVCEDGNGKTVFTKEIEFTAFPLDEITLYFTNNTILLPSEY